MKEATLVGGEKVIAHDPEKCTGQTCCVHKPSQHHMRLWDQHWRNDTKVMERICEHGVGHPDPDHLDYKRQFLRLDEREWDSIHGCDGCCNPLLAGDAVARFEYTKQRGVPWNGRRG